MALPQSIQTARLLLASDHGYLSGVLWNLRPVEKPGIGTMGVDHNWRLYYDPAIDQKWNEEQVTAVLMHECNHVLRKHQLDNRAKPFMHCMPVQPECSGCGEASETWNWAADAEINPGLRKLGFKLPPEGIFPEKFLDKQGKPFPDGLLAEEYFDLFTKWKQGQSKQGKGKGQGNEHGQACGSVAGNPQDYEDGEPAESDKLSETEKELILRDVAKKIEDRIKQQGKVPAGLERWAHEILHPKVPWQKELRVSSLRNIAECAGKREYSFKRPHRRQAVLETVAPTLRDFKPRVGIIRDTSGSMNDNDLAKTLAETKGILDTLHGEIIDIEVDCKVQDVKKISNVRQIHMKGGGGTDMGVGIEHAATLKPRLDLCVVLTDGETPWPSHKPPFKVIVVLTRENTRNKVPSWAKCIVVN